MQTDTSANPSPGAVPSKDGAGEVSHLPAAQAHTGVAGLSTTGEALAGVTMVIGALLVAFAVRRRVMARAGAGRAPAPVEAGPEQAHGRVLSADLTELTDRLALKLDAKAGHIESLIALADERIARLEKLEFATREAPAWDHRLAEPRQVRPRETPQAAHRDVYELADAGLRVIEIARRLDRPTGQVELILNLRKGTVAL